MTREEHDKIIHLMEHGSLHGIDTGRLDGKCESVIPLEDAIAIIDSVYKSESDDNSYEKFTEEDAIVFLMYLLANQDELLAEMKKSTKEAEEAGMTLSEYLDSSNPFYKDYKCKCEQNGR